MPKKNDSNQNVLWDMLTTPRDEATLESPIFLLGCGWCSGVKDVQRHLETDVWFWGEPFERSSIVDGFLRVWSRFRSQWPPASFFLPSRNNEDLESQFIANLYPSVDALIESQRKALGVLFKPPASWKKGNRWGIRESRWSADHACLLRLLYPKCKIVVVYRNPYLSFEEFHNRRKNSKPWWYRWPDDRVGTEVFAEVWRKATCSFLLERNAIDAYVANLDEFRDHSNIDRLMHYCEVDSQSIRNEQTLLDSHADVDSRSDLTMYFNQIEDIVGETASSIGFFRNDDEVSRDVVSSNGSSPTDSSPELAARMVIENTVVLARIRPDVSPEFEELLESIETFGMAVRRVASSSIDISRSIAVTRAILDGFENIMLIESDIVFDPSTLVEFISNPSAIISGIVPSRVRNGFRCNIAESDRSLALHAANSVELTLCDLSFVRIKKQVFMDVQKKLRMRFCNEQDGVGFVPFFCPISRESETGYFSDDTSFIRLAIDCGHKLVGDPSIRVGEIVRTIFCWQDIVRSE